MHVSKPSAREWPARHLATRGYGLSIAQCRKSARSDSSLSFTWSTSSRTATFLFVIASVNPLSLEAIGLERCKPTCHCKEVVPRALAWTCWRYGFIINIYLNLHSVLLLKSVHFTLAREKLCTGSEKVSASYRL